MSSKAMTNLLLFVVILLILYFVFPGVLDVIIGFIGTVLAAFVEFLQTLVNAIVKLFKKA